MILHPEIKANNIEETVPGSHQCKGKQTHSKQYTNKKQGYAGIWKWHGEQICLLLQPAINNTSYNAFSKYHVPRMFTSALLFDPNDDPVGWTACPFYGEGNWGSGSCDKWAKVLNLLGSRVRIPVWPADCGSSPAAVTPNCIPVAEVCDSSTLNKSFGFQRVGLRKYAFSFMLLKTESVIKGIPLRPSALKW